MSVSADKYRPPDASERLMPGPPYRGCRISSDFYCTAFATLGESTLAPAGGEMSRAAIKAVLNRGWAGFKRAGDENGWPDQGDVDDYHGAMFPNLPMPRLVTTRDFDEVRSLVGRFVVSIALRLSALPASSPLRKFTSADHQLCWFDVGNGMGSIIDPMGPVGGDGKARYLAPVAHIREAALAIPLVKDGPPGRTVIAELYPKGGWTAESLAKREASAASASDEATIRRLRRERNAALAKLAECQAGTPTDCTELVKNARAAAWEGFGNAVITHTQQLLNEGEPA
jgi:hypothetical protein